MPRASVAENRTGFRDAVREALIADAEGLFRQFWGDPVRPNAASWRPKGDGAKAMVMRGPERGLWHDHISTLGGDLFDLVAVEVFGLTRAKDDFPKVLNEAAAFVGITESSQIDRKAIEARRLEREAGSRAQTEREERAKAELVSALTAKSKPIEGSPAAAYLASRGINIFPDKGLAYIPPVSTLPVKNASRDALAVWATDANGTIRGGQRILILPDGSKAPDEIRKPAFASTSGYPARFPARFPDGPLCICEGPESALSVWQATGFESWAVFGVSGWASLRLPAGRKIVLCPDQDMPVGSFPEGSEDAQRKEAAARTFNGAVNHHVASGADIWIALAPEPKGSKRDLNDTLQRAGNAAVADAISKAVPAPKGPNDNTRTQSGRYTGQGLVPFVGDIPETPAPLPLSKARAKTDLDIRTALSACKTWDDTSPGLPPVHAIKADPGIGKSRMARKRIAEMARKNALTGDVHFYVPTLDLADEGAAHMDELGAGNAVKRGRLAKNPQTGDAMCLRPVEVEQASKAGLSIAPTMCRTEDEYGMERRCPFFEQCAYQKQETELGEGPVIRFMSHTYLNLPKTAKDRPVMLRLIDEAFWRGQFREARITADDLCGTRTPGKCKDPQQRDARLGTIADLMQVASDILTALRMGQSIGEAIADCSADELRGFAKAEHWGQSMPPIFPDSSKEDVLKTLKALESAPTKASGHRAAFWNLLAEAKEAGITDPQNIEFKAGFKPTKSSEPRDIVRLSWSVKPPHDKPIVLLDADADPVILAPFYPNAVLSETRVKPNANVVQIVDKVFSKTTLLNSKAARDEWAGILAVEALRDAFSSNGGVLAVATKRVVQTFFEDEGFRFEDMDPSEVNRVMMDTPLHGVKWAWFGAATLGSNRWRDCTTVVTIGREEWPPQALESIARGIWGHGLELLEPDPAGNTLMPEVVAPFMLANGDTMGVKIKAHPDPRIRAIQMQSREMASRQTIERLRLAQATTAKRVVVGCSVPIPGLPVDEAVTWEAFKPSRSLVALAEANGALRISPKGLALDAPRTFRSEKAAAKYLERNDFAEALFNPHTPNNNTISGAGVKKVVLAQFKLSGQRGRFPTRAVLLCDPVGAALVAEEKWGALRDFKIVQIIERSASSDAAPNEVFCIQESCDQAPSPADKQTSENASQDFLSVAAGTNGRVLYLPTPLPDGFMNSSLPPQERRQAVAGMFWVEPTAAPPYRLSKARFLRGVLEGGED